MRMFSGMRPWQKAFIFGLMFIAFLGVIFTSVLIVADIMLDSKGLTNTCYMVTKTVDCSLGDAIASRLLFFMIFVMVIGIPFGILAGLLGYMFEKIRGD
jgi:hypothetical protein